MRRGENPSVVLAALRDRIADLDQHALPAGIRLHPFYDRTDLVDTTLDTVFHNLGEGAALVTVVLFIFLLSLRASLVVTIVIPLSLAASFIYLRSRGMSANLLSMGAVDFGIIVDGAVILVEHVFGHCAGDDYQRKPAAARIEAIYQAAREVARPTLFSLLIIVAAYLPIFALQRVEGRIFAPMAHTVVSALIGGMLVSFTLVPVLCFFALRRHKPIRQSPVLRAAARVYQPALTHAMRNPVAVLLGALALVWGRVEARAAAGHRVPARAQRGRAVRDLHPAADDLADRGPPADPADHPAHAARRPPEITELMSQLGRPEDGTDPTLLNNLEVFVVLRPMAQWRPQIHTLDDIIEQMNRNLKEIPGNRVQLQPADPRQRRREHQRASSARSRSSCTATTSISCRSSPARSRTRSPRSPASPIWAS